MCAYILGNDPVIGRADAVERTVDGQSIPVGGTLKRVFDVLGASVALIVLAPLMLLVATLVRLVLGGAALFTQKRVGFGGKTFDCYRFRTIRPDGERASHDQGNDPRATCLSNVLCQLGIDQLPQLFNVLRGDMSLVGPYPVSPREIPRYGRHARAYYSARPGLTGMRQVDRRKSVDRIARDRYYARHWSLGLDLLLLLKTLSRQKKGRGCTTSR
jgi:exopolysaccharide production protein ExoY